MFIVTPFRASGRPPRIYGGYRVTSNIKFLQKTRHRKTKRHASPTFIVSLD